MTPLMAGFATGLLYRSPGICKRHPQRTPALTHNTASQTCMHQAFHSGIHNPLPPPPRLIVCTVSLYRVASGWSQPHQRGHYAGQRCIGHGHGGRSIVCYSRPAEWITSYQQTLLSVDCLWSAVTAWCRMYAIVSLSLAVLNHVSPRPPPQKIAQIITAPLLAGRSPDLMHSLVHSRPVTQQHRIQTHRSGWPVAARCDVPVDALGGLLLRPRDESLPVRMGLRDNLVGLLATSDLAVPQEFVGGLAVSGLRWRH